MIAIVGLGYVGLPLCLQFARSGVKVLGIDIDAAKVEALTQGESYIAHISSSDVSEQLKAGRLGASVDFSRVAECDAIIICVPTPLTKHREPDISYITQTGKTIAPNLQRGTLVVLESTTYPGTTEEDLREVLEAGASGESPKRAGGSPALPAPETPRRMTAGIDFHLAFSPEREDPGNPKSKVADIPKIVGGLTPECTRRAVELYAKAIKTVIPVSSCRAAEATKLLENIFRSVNIALVNELKIVYGAMGIDVWEVINAAKTKPFGFMPFYPGPGLGGHCIPIDPFYLTWKAREYGQHTRFIELAGEINTAMPHYVVEKLIETLNGLKKPLNGARILLLGLAYKADVDDMRESPTFVLMNLLEAKGAQVDYHDPHVPVIKPTREHAHYTGKKSVEWREQIVAGYDAVLISTAHKAVNYQELADWSKLIIDTRNAMAGIKTREGQVTKA